METTLKNLHKAFIGESQARNRYTMAAKQATKDGYEQIAEIFTETAEQEREHAKQLSKMINQLVVKMGKEQGSVEVMAEGAAMFADTIKNLENAINGENYEHTTMYPEFAAKAKEEGLDDIAKRLISIGLAEKHHEERYQKLVDQIKAGTLFEKEEVKAWKCRKCGYIHLGKTPPVECPSCSHGPAYFQIKCEEY